VNVKELINKFKSSDSVKPITLTTNARKGPRLIEEEFKGKATKKEASLFVSDLNVCSHYPN